ncbi:flagellar filament capping protein FliD [Paenibacillus sp. NPDC056933]|uniref:flagellar filament capping protein FliD n=1 Tax=Paenibacillus sp. NPDC056933 TaxID=3345968 RepID=UPI0036321ED8
MRINGFSGMDIDSMVTSLMTAKKLPLNKLNQQKQILEWTRESYRELNSKIVQLSDKLQKMNRSEAMNTKLSTISGNTTALKADANSNASSTPMSVEITQLAAQSHLSTKANETLNATLSTTLGEIAGSDTPGEYELNINDKNIKFNSTDSITTVIAKINSGGANVTASFDEISGKFSITAKEYGTKNNIKLQDGATNTLLALLKTGTGSADVNAAVNGSVKVKNLNDGTEKTYSPEGNTLTVNGVKLTLLEKTDSNNPVKVTTQSDPAKAMETIKSFVDTYNELLGMMNTKLSEQKFRDFAPLTADQKKDMKEDEIKNWEEKSKSGLLKNDSILSTAVSSMRMVIAGQLGDLSSFGITTGQYYEKGKLQINEEKLKAALTADPDKVLSVFQGSGSDGTKKPIFSELRSQLNTPLDMFAKKVGTSKYDSNASISLNVDSIMGKQLKEYKSRITEFERKMKDAETRYYKQFTAMESAMNKYQSQSSSLTSYLQ